MSGREACTSIQLLQIPVSISLPFNFGILASFFKKECPKLQSKLKTHVVIIHSVGVVVWCLTALDRLKNQIKEELELQSSQVKSNRRTAEQVPTHHQLWSFTKQLKYFKVTGKVKKKVQKPCKIQTATGELQNACAIRPTPHPSCYCTWFTSADFVATTTYAISSQIKMIYGAFRKLK